jgi:hypothetical protein
LRREKLPLHQFRLLEIDEASLRKNMWDLLGHSGTTTTTSRTASDPDMR